MKEILKKIVGGVHYGVDDLYIFPNRAKEKVQKKIDNAINSYTDLSQDHELYLLADTTLFGSAKEGFLLTAERLYSDKLPKEGVPLTEISSFGRLKSSSVDVFQNDKKVGYLFLPGDEDEAIYELLNMYVNIYKLVKPLEDQEISKDELIEKAIEKIENSYFKTPTLSIDDFQVGVLEEDEISGEEKTVVKTEKKPMLPIIEKTIFLMLTPLYLFLIYYKTVMGADLEGLIAVSFVIFILYLPIQILVTENDLELTFDAIFNNYDVVSYLRIVFGILGLLALFTLSHFLPFGKEMEKMFTTGIGIVIYGLWWFLTNRLLKLANEGSDEAKVKIIGWLIFIMTLVLASFMSELPNKIGFEYFLTLAVMIFQVSIVTLLLIPSIGIRVFWNILVAIVKSGLKSAFGSNKKSYSTSNAKDLEESLQVPMAILLLAVMFLVPFIDWINSIVADVDPYMTAIGLTLSMIFISAMGAYFQVRIFVATLVKDVARHKTVTLTVLGVFYGAMIVNMGIVNTIENSSTEIKKVQRGFDMFNRSIQERTR